MAKGKIEIVEIDPTTEFRVKFTLGIKKLRWVDDEYGRGSDEVFVSLTGEKTVSTEHLGGDAEGIKNLFAITVDELIADVEEKLPQKEAGQWRDIEAANEAYIESLIEDGGGGQDSPYPSPPTQQANYPDNYCPWQPKAEDREVGQYWVERIDTYKYVPNSDPEKKGWFVLACDDMGKNRQYAIKTEGRKIFESHGAYPTGELFDKMAAQPNQDMKPKTNTYIQWAYTGETYKDKIRPVAMQMAWGKNALEQLRMSNPFPPEGEELALDQDDIPDDDINF